MFNFIDYVTANKESFVEMNEKKTKVPDVRGGHKGSHFECLKSDGKTKDPKQKYNNHTGKCEHRSSKEIRKKKKDMIKAVKTRKKNKGKEAKAQRQRLRSMAKRKGGLFNK